MILGIGVDIVSTDRIARLLSIFGCKFVDRILTSQELSSFGSIKNDQDRLTSFISKRFVAKEAMVKAIGCGIGKHCGFHDVVIVKDIHGKPFVKKTPAIIVALNNFLSVNNAAIHLSISDEKHYAVAQVVIESV